MPLSATKVVYQDILDATNDLDLSSSQTDKVDLVLDPIWASQSSCSHGFLDDILPSDESILEAMSDPDRTWDDMHH
jgi:hypothetical protein